VQRILRGTQATISYTHRDADGSPVEVAGVTVGIRRADETDLVPSGTATVKEGKEHRYALTPKQTSLLDQLTATWTVDGASHETVVEVVGGFYFSVQDVRAADRSLEDPGRYPASDLLATRQEVEDEFERICGVAFVPRYRRVTIDGSDRAVVSLPSRRLRAVRDVVVGGVAWTTTDLSDVRWGAGITRADGTLFPAGVRNITVGYEHGWSEPPSEIRRAALTRLRSRLNFSRSAIPDRATSFSVAEGGTYRLDTAGRSKTGIDEVDAALARYTEGDLSVGSLVVGGRG
jgi:hypothetical protein